MCRILKIIIKWHSRLNCGYGIVTFQVSANNKMLALRTALSECCCIYVELPSATMSVIDGDGIRCFRQPGAANSITIYPRLHDGTPATYIRSDDVQLLVSDLDHKLVHAQVQLDMGSDGRVALQYTLSDNYHRLTQTELRVCMRVCGVLLVDVRVHAAAFDGRTAGHHCGQHMLAYRLMAMAIHPSGDYLVVSKFCTHSLSVLKLPDMRFLISLGSNGNRPKNLDSPRGLCFTDAGTLLVADFGNHRVQHWTLEGLSIVSTVSYAVNYPVCVASRGDIFVTGTIFGICVCALESGAVYTNG